MVWVWVYPIISSGQGCSDAGFCTMGAMRPNQAYSSKLKLILKSVEISQYYGLTSFYLKVIAYNTDINIGVSRRFSIQAKLPYQFVQGFLANTQGLGDVSLSTTFNAYASESLQINVSLGAKIPTNDANLKAETKLKSNGQVVSAPLPMYYQTSLGSYDAIAGISMISRKWLYAVGYQQALTSNGNDFLWGRWNKTEDSAVAAQYPISKQLRRGTDVMARIEHNMRFTNWNIYAGLLAIFRITNDRIITPSGTTYEVKTKDYMLGEEKLPFVTGNMALSLLIGGGYRFTTKSGIKAMIGYRLVDRASLEIFGGKEKMFHKNPDGLSRMLVTNVGYEYRF